MIDLVKISEKYEKQKSRKCRNDNVKTLIKHQLFVISFQALLRETLENFEQNSCKTSPRQVQGLILTQQSHQTLLD